MFDYISEKFYRRFADLARVHRILVAKDQSNVRSLIPNSLDTQWLKHGVKRGRLQTRA